MTKRFGDQINTKIDIFSLEFLQPLRGTKHTRFEAFYDLLKEFYGEQPSDLSIGDYTPCQNFTQKFSVKELKERWQWDIYELMMFFKTLAYDKIIILHKFGWDDEIIATLNESWEREVKGR
jgi:hypothetical protein